MQSPKAQQVPDSIFRAMKSYLWSEGRPNANTWFIRTYALPVFSKAAYDRCKEKGGMSHLVVWDSRNLRGQALRLVRVQTIMQMEVHPKPVWTVTLI